jgi:hypothetical protein
MIQCLVQKCPQQPLICHRTIWQQIIIDNFQIMTCAWPTNTFLNFSCQYGFIVVPLTVSILIISYSSHENTAVSKYNKTFFGLFENLRGMLPFSLEYSPDHTFGPTKKYLQFPLLITHSPITWQITNHVCVRYSAYQVFVHKYSSTAWGWQIYQLSIDYPKESTSLGYHMNIFFCLFIPAIAKHEM